MEQWSVLLIRCVTCNSDISITFFFDIFCLQQVARIIQGIPGAYSEAAALKAFPESETVPCDEYEAVFKVMMFPKLLGCHRIFAQIFIQLTSIFRQLNCGWWTKQYSQLRILLMEASTVTMTCCFVIGFT